MARYRSTSYHRSLFYLFCLISLFYAVTILLLKAAIKSLLSGIKENGRETDKRQRNVMVEGLNV